MRKKLEYKSELGGKEKYLKIRVKRKKRKEKRKKNKEKRKEKKILLNLICI